MRDVPQSSGAPVASPAAVEPAPPSPAVAFIIPPPEPHGASADVSDKREATDETKKLRFPAAGDSFPAQGYGALDGDACLRELQRRLIPHSRVSKARGVDTPIRLTGP